LFKHELGDGVELRILETRHSEEFLKFVDENRAFLGRWLRWGVEIKTPEEAEAFLRRGIERYVEDGLPWVGIWLGGEMVGGVLFFPVESRTLSTEVGYWLGEGAVGRGLVTRAVSAMLDYAFGALGLHRVALQAEVGNEKSIAVARRLGFTEEGIRRAAGVNSGRYVDMAAFSLLAEEWALIRERSVRHTSPGDSSDPTPR
jgi:ribosomal-protein-serine acetyltransferase